ncbi:beta-ribofuranosylaminobenzene 5'-phosphate synthase [Neorhodopirellula lusitana]|uniref:beta-ribofuranosylaminobenzene 5'-phosphate synthase n=1 Tax=Neorhodopirellula lusitana TaxID=445327 RepID=UPI00384C688C
MIQVVRVTTGARLHFGLLDVAAPFGGCGVMVDHPETIVEVEPSDQFRLIGSPRDVERHTDRVRAIAGRLASLEKSSTESRLPAVQVRLVQVAPPHTGLGSGTQLSLAVTEAIVRTLSMSSPEEEGFQERLIHAADRGLRSAVGTYGYFHGGFLAEGFDAKASGALNALDVRMPLPDEWCAVVLLPCLDEQQGATSAEGEIDDSVCVSGLQEQQKFDQLPATRIQRDVLRSILVDQIVPAIRTAEFGEFADAVTAYNRASGELFASVQGGAYNGPEITAVIEDLIESGQRGVGQSSWGPGVFAWFEKSDQAVAFCRDWSGHARRPLMVRPRTQGRSCKVHSRTSG